MLFKIKRQGCLEKYQSFPLRGYDYDKDEEIFFYPEIFKSYLLTLPSKSFRGHVTALGNELVHLAKALHADAFVFLGDTETPWQYQHNNYPPAKEAQAFLTTQKIGKRFNGALQVSILELPRFTRHLAWLVRCNAALPYFYFLEESQNLIGNICQYGNLHIDTLNEQGDKILNSFVEDSRFTYGNINDCNNLFGKTSAISGRKTVL